MQEEQSFGWGTIPGGCVAARDRAAIAGDRAAATAWVLARRVIYPRLFSHKRDDVKLSLG